MPMLRRNIDPLTEDQIRWAPGPGRNPIRWQIWHIAEVEDNWVRTTMLGQQPRFPLGVPLAEDAGGPEPTKADLLEYLRQVRALTRDRLGAIGAGEFDRSIDEPDFGSMTIRDLWAGVVTSFAWHAGQIALTAKLLPDTPVRTWTFTPWTSPRRTR